MCDEKDGLTSEVERLQAGSQAGGAGVEQAGELTRLQAENVVLQKSLQGMYQFIARGKHNTYITCFYIFHIWQLCKRDFEKNQVLSKLKKWLRHGLVLSIQYSEYMYVHFDQLLAARLCAYSSSPSRSGDEQQPSDQGSSARGMLFGLPMEAACLCCLIFLHCFLHS